VEKRPAPRRAPPAALPKEPEARRGKKVWVLAPLLAIAGWWACTSGEDGLRARHAEVVRKAEALRLPVNFSSDELEALERMGPLLDSVAREMGGMNELKGKIRIILRGLELLRNDTLHEKPGLSAFRGAWDALTTSWGGAERMLPADAAVALAGVETSFRTAETTLSSATGLWQLVNPKPPAGAQLRFDKPASYWQQQYNACFDRLDGIANLELRKQTAGMLAHWLNNAHHIDRMPDADALRDIRTPLIVAQYLNGPSLLNRATDRSLRIVTQATAIGKNPPPRIYVARFAVYLAIVRAYVERTQMEGMGAFDSNTPLEQHPTFQDAVRKHLWRALTTPNLGVELHSPSEPTWMEQWIG
jgi:hypothetical protein